MGQIDERDRMRLEYLNPKVWKDDATCLDMLRLNRACDISIKYIIPSPLFDMIKAQPLCNAFPSM